MDQRKANGDRHHHQGGGVVAGGQAGDIGAEQPEPVHRGGVTAHSPADCRPPEGAGQEHVEAIDLGDDGLFPRFESPCGQQSGGQGDAVRRPGTPFSDQGQQGGAQKSGPAGAHRRGHQVEAPGDGLAGKMAEEVADQGIEGISGLVGHAQMDRGGDEFAAVFERDGRGEGQQIAGKGDGAG